MQGLHTQARSRGVARATRLGPATPHTEGAQLGNEAVAGTVGSHPNWHTGPTVSRRDNQPSSAARK